MSDQPRDEKKKKPHNFKLDPIPPQYAKKGRNGEDVVYRLPTLPPGITQPEDQPKSATYGPIEPGLQTRGYTESSIQQRRYTAGVGQSTVGSPGLPTSATGWPDAGASQYNDHYGASLDPYRNEDGIAEPNRTPPQSSFKKDYENYKNLDAKIEKDTKAIKEHCKTANASEAMRRRDAATKARKSGRHPIDTEQYGGKPLESKSWHEEQRRLKEQASSTMRQCVTFKSITKRRQVD